MALMFGPWTSERRALNGYSRSYAAVTVAEERDVFAQAWGVMSFTCQLVIEGSLVSTSRR